MTTRPTGWLLVGYTCVTHKTGSTKVDCRNDDAGPFYHDDLYGAQHGNAKVLEHVARE